MKKKDSRDCQIELSFEEIMKNFKSNFKQLVKKACENACFSKLKEQKNKLSKGKEIKYHQFQRQSYLIPGSNISSDDMCNILKCRIRDLDLKGNFPNAYEDKKCPFTRCNSPESQFHFAYCEFYSDNSIIPRGIEYADLFESDVQKQFQIMKVLTKRMEERNKKFGTSLRTRRGPEDPRMKERRVRKGVTRNTTRQPLSLVIRGRKNIKSLRIKKNNTKQHK